MMITSRKLFAIALLTAATGGCADMSEDLDTAQAGLAEITCAPDEPCGRTTGDIGGTGVVGCDLAPLTAVEDDGLYLNYARWYDESRECLVDDLGSTAALPAVTSLGLFTDPRDPTGSSYVKVVDMEANSVGAIAAQFADVVVAADPSLLADKAQITAGLADVLTQFKSDLVNETWGPAYYPPTDGGAVARVRQVVQATPVAWFGPEFEVGIVERVAPVPVIVLPVYTTSMFAGGQISLGGGISIGYIHSASPYPSNVYLPYNTHGFGITIRF